MEKWRRKVLLTQVIGALPAGDRLMDLYRYHFSGLRTHNLDSRWYSITEMLQIIREARIEIAGKDLAEIGSGWHPLLAPMFYGLGAKSIRMTDISPHVRTEFVEKTVGYLIQRVAEVATLSGVSAPVLEGRLRELLPGGRDWRPVFAGRGITYQAPLDFTATGWPAGCVDLIFSNSCIAYIPAPVLQAIHHESFRVLRPGGFLAHNLDPIDVLTGSLNFLKFSHGEWEKVGCSSLHYQNRLRPAQHLAMVVKAGFLPRYEARLPFPKPQALNRAELHPDFRDLPESELLCFHYLYAAQKPTG